MIIPSLQSHGSGRGPRGEQAMAVIVVIGLLALLMIYLAASARTLHYLHRDLKLIEQRQQQRLSPPSKTNSVTVTNLGVTTPRAP